MSRGKREPCTLRLKRPVCVECRPGEEVVRGAHGEQSACQATWGAAGCVMEEGFARMGGSEFAFHEAPLGPLSVGTDPPFGTCQRPSMFCGLEAPPGWSLRLGFCT